MQCNHEQRGNAERGDAAGNTSFHGTATAGEDRLLIRCKIGGVYPPLILSLPALQHGHAQCSQEHLQEVFVNWVPAGQGRRWHKGIPAPSHLTEGPENNEIINASQNTNRQTAQELSRCTHWSKDQQVCLFSISLHAWEVALGEQD